LKWVAPKGHKPLRAFRILIGSFDNKIKRELAVKHNADRVVNSFLIDDLAQTTSYTVVMKSICVFESLKTISDEEKLTFSSLPKPPTNLTLENCQPNSLTIKWEPPLQAQASHKYHLAIESASIGYSADYSTAGDKNMFNFSKLPDIFGTGNTAEYS
jgi:hypothetical protein